MARTLETRLLNNRVIINEHWIWTGCDNGKYGQISFRDKMEFVHRISAMLYLKYDMNSNLIVLHKCEEKRCFNPEHLYLGDYSDNAKDSYKAGQKVRNQHMKKSIFVKKEYE